MKDKFKFKFFQTKKLAFFFINLDLRIDRNVEILFHKSKLIEDIEIYKMHDRLLCRPFSEMRYKKKFFEIFFEKKFFI